MPALGGPIAGRSPDPLFRYAVMYRMYGMPALGGPIAGQILFFFISDCEKLSEYEKKMGDF